MSTPRRPTVLITNDDGPPSAASSPFVYSLVQAIEAILGWECIVVLPDSQKSWIGKAFLIHEEVPLYYYYPQHPDGYASEKSDVRRALKQNERKEWILLGGTPATCSSVGLRNLYPGKIDLVVSGPNFGRNTSSAFALSSGTVGAALAASMSHIPAIALSYGIFQKPVSPDILEAAHKIACSVIEQLWKSGFTKEADRVDEDGVVDLYNVNVPLVPSIVTEPVVRFTSLAPARYGRLFSVVPAHEQSDQSDALDKHSAAPISELNLPNAEKNPVATLGGKLRFEFKPDIASMINPKASDLVDGTDKHAVHTGVTSVTPLRAAFAAGLVPDTIKGLADEKGFWKL